MRPFGKVMVCAAASLFFSAACEPREPSTAARSGVLRGALAPPALEEDESQWVMAAKNYASTRFSGLDQINAANVAQLRPAWEFATGNPKGHEAAPLIAEGMLYIVTPYPNVVYAFDLTAPGKVRWKFEPKPDPASQGVACCDVVNRGMALHEGRLFFNTLDGQAIALDARSGTELWRTKLGDIQKGESMTMAPLVVKDKVLVGNSGAEFGVRGWIAALDVATGREVWRAWSTGPDRDVLIGPSFEPFYDMDRGKDLGVHSWPPGAWQIGGGTVWGWISYDPELDLIYYGTANPGPWNAEQRPGDNKWTCGVFARDPDTGEARWFYQFSPHDLYDHDGVNELILLDLELDGRKRPVLVRPERNGHVYVIDRATGEVLSANPYAHVTTNHGVDLESGRLIPNVEKEPRMGRAARDVCPGGPGAKDWQPSSFSPATGLLYIPHQNICMDIEGVEANYIAGTPYVGANVKYYAGPGGHRGEVTAWDPVAGRAVWKIRESFPVWSGTLATAGELVFYGTMDGWFKAIHARTGQELWKHRTPSGIIGQPVTWRGPDGRQYVAVMSGVGGWAGVLVSNELDPRDASAGHGWGSMMADLPKHTGRGGTLHVFALP